MRKEEVILNNPLRALGLEDEAGEGKTMGLVMARAGLGKTAVLVQIALDFMSRGNKVLHVSIGETVDKARNWYDDIFSTITKGMEEEERQAFELETMKNRMIMTFKESSFDLATLEERLDDLVKQDVYCPDYLIVDGLDFTENVEESLKGFYKLMETQNLKMIWYSAVSHREDGRASETGVPAPCHEVDNMFETVLCINPDGDSITLDIIKCEACEIDARAKLRFDPSTMLISKA
jgi:hypothetical protein